MRKPRRPLIESLESRDLMAGTYYVAPLSVAEDATHYHRLVQAVSAATPASTIYVMYGALYDSTTVTIDKLNLTIAGDPSLPAAELQRYTLVLTASGINLTNLAINTLTINSGVGVATVLRCDLLNLIVTGNTATGNGFNTFDSNFIRGRVFIQGNTSGTSADVFTHNTMESVTGITVENDNGFVMTDNTLNISESFGLVFLPGGTNTTVLRNYIRGNAVAMQLGGGSGIVANNIFSTFGKGTGMTGLSTSAYRIEGNDFTDNKAGVYFLGDGNAQTVISFDFGGGTQGSNGGNNFRTFTSAANAAFSVNTVNSSAVLYARGNIYDLNRTIASVMSVSQGQVSATALTATQGFVANTYNTFLKRSPTSGDYTYWSSVYTASGQAAVINGIQRSAEGLRVAITDQYQKYLRRAVDATGLNFWTSQIQGGLSFSGFVSSLVSSVEFIAGHNSDYIQSLYQTILGRSAESAGISFWYSQLPMLGLQGVANSIVTTAETRTNAITADFARYMHRAPNQLEYTILLNQNLDDFTLLTQIFSSLEYYTIG